ncbi:hypothetical protein BXZ70DRAFT_764608 [Cristinia sonorae]|uniref:Uncharacterized protein n=1 Tax=Cristinia sonorae TaxID=1940300 RepID=A0A8K0XRY4_9AGAR|nr:hypothetical protein BXZ70DRAFT_764608 [Cristinia sonorae]
MQCINIASSLVASFHSSLSFSSFSHLSTYCLSISSLTTPPSTFPSSPSPRSTRDLVYPLARRGFSSSSRLILRLVSVSVPTIPTPPPPTPYSFSLMPYSAVFSSLGDILAWVLLVDVDIAFNDYTRRTLCPTHPTLRRPIPAPSTTTSLRTARFLGLGPHTLPTPRSLSFLRLVPFPFPVRIVFRLQKPVSHIEKVVPKNPSHEETMPFYRCCTKYNHFCFSSLPPHNTNTSNAQTVRRRLLHPLINFFPPALP